MNHVVSVIGLGSLHQAHSTVLPGRRASSLMLFRMGGFTASNLISKQVGSSGLVTVVEPRLRIPFAPAFQWLVFGWRQPEKIQRSPTGLSKRKNVRMVNDRVE